MSAFEEWWDKNGIPQETPSDLVEAYKRAMKYAFYAGLDHAAAVAKEFKLNEPSTPTERIYNVACDDFASAILREKEE